MAVKLLDHGAVQQIHKGAREIMDILTAASADCRMSRDLRQRLAAAKERVERIAHIIETSDLPMEHAAKSGVKIPTVHLNGTSGEVLRHQYITASEALRRAMDATCEARPNDRDYYVQDPEAGAQAQREHRARVISLGHIREELEAISSGIWQQLEKRQPR